MGTTKHLILVILAIQYVAAQIDLDSRSKDPSVDGGLKEGPKQRIIGGQDADQGEYPFMVRWKLIPGLGVDHLCGGSLIKPNIVLTAAHCVVEGTKAPVEVVVAVVGDHTGSGEEGTEQEMEVKRIIVHENYHKNPYGIPIDDIALIVLKEDVRLVEGVVSTVNLAKDDSLYAEGTAVTVIGWGVDDEEMLSADTLQEFEYEIANKEECKKHWEEDYKKYEDVLGVVDFELDMDTILGFTFCTIDPARQATVYSGDSGGPLFVKDGNTFTQIGVVSWAEVDPTIKTYNMFMDVHHYGEWLQGALDRAEDHSWLELSTGASHGIVMVHDKEGGVTTVCNDNVGDDEINAICREQGFKMGALADVRDYLPGRRKQKEQAAAGLPPYGYTNMNCGDDVKDVMEECTMTRYEDAEVPCFRGQQLAVKCADEEWAFRITHMIPEMKMVTGSQYAKGKFNCLVQAEKYGIPLDIKSQVKVGLVIRGEDGIEDIGQGQPMKYRKKTGIHIGKFKPIDEIMADSCFACIAYLPGAEFCTVAKYGPDDCPDNEDHYMDWVRKQNAAQNGGSGGDSGGGGGGPSD